MPDNLNSKPPDQEATSGLRAEGSDVISSAREDYNLATDLVTGVNVRSSDNKFQVKFVAVSVLLFTLLGLIFALRISNWKMPLYGGAMIGAVGGLVFGTLASGIYLMIYRTSRHIRGKHD